MSAETLVAGLNALQVAVLSLTSLVGTAALLKLVSTFFRLEPRRPRKLNFTVEDA